MKKRLGDYIQEYSVRNKSGEDIPVYSITNSQGFCRDYFSKEVASKDKTSYKIVPRGCFAYNPSRINVGSVDWQRDEERVIVSPLYNVFSVSPEIDQQYLYYYLKSSATLYRIKEVATGSVRDNLRLSMLYDFMIELPSLDVQRQIVSNLDLLASIIRQRNQQLTKLDELIKARFVEMFENNTYPKVKVSTVCDFITKGTTPPNDLISEEYSSDKVPYLKVYNLSFNGELLFDTAPQYISENIHNGMLARSKVYPNDVLMNIVGPPLGKFSLVTDEFPEWNINQAIAIFRAKEKINPKYLLSALMQPEVLNPFLRQAVGIRQLNLSLSQCRDLEIFLPPLSLQNQFADFVAEVDKSKLLVGSAAAHKPFDIGFFSQKHCATLYKRGIINSNH